MKKDEVDRKILEDTDAFLKAARRMNALIYGGAGVVILLIVSLTGIPEKYWMPVFVIYGVSALAHMAEGMTAINLQMVAISEYWQESLGKDKGKDS